MEEGFKEMLTEVRQMFLAVEGTKEEKRQEVHEAIEDTYQMAEAVLLPLLLMDSRNGVNFVQRVNETLGVVNEVALEYSIEPFHIKDFDLPTVDALEEEFDMSIDEITGQGE